MQDKRIDRDRLDEIVDIILETVCSSRKKIRIAGDDYSRRILEKLRMFVYNVFCIIMSIRKERRMKGYLSIRETSYKWGVSERRVNQYVAQGRVPGAERFGRSWAIPEDAVKPVDPRKIQNTLSHK